MHQFYQRGEAVLTSLDGRLVNYFGVNYTNTSNWNKAPDPAAPGVNKGDRTRYDWHSVFEALPGQFLITGLQQETERLDTGTLMASNGTTSAFAELQTQLAQRLFLVSNVRYDENDAFGNRTTYRLAPAVLVPVTETKLKASLGTGFKTPTLSQLFVDFRPAFNFFGNPNLLPEQSVGYDFGFEQPIANDRFASVSPVITTISPISSTPTRPARRPTWARPRRQATRPSHRRPSPRASSSAPPSVW